MNILRVIVKMIIPLKYRDIIRRRIDRARFIKKAFLERDRPRSLLRFDIHVADHCNLNCKGCEHFSPLASNVFLDTNVFERDCKRIAELTNGVLEDIAVLGGEPLLHKELPIFLDIARKYFKTCKLWIVTNGLLLTKQSEEFWLNCNKNNVEITITVYPVNLNYKPIEELCKKYDVKLSYWGGKNNQENNEWVLRPLDTKGTQGRRRSWNKCYQGNRCIQLVDSKLFTCARSAYIKYFNNAFNQELKITDKDYIDIFKANSISEIFDFLCKPIPFCRYCDMKRMIWDREWGISHKAIDEWIKT